MNVHAAAARTEPTSPVSSETDTRLRGRQLLYARIAYVAIAAIVFALNLAALPSIYASQLTPEQLHALYRAGFSPTIYALIATGTGVVSFLLYLSLSLLVFWRRSEERMAWFCAVMLVTFGGVAANPLDDATSGGPMPQPMASVPVLTVTVHLLIVVGQVLFVVFFYLFPSGRFVPRWTRLLALLALAYWFGDIFFPALVIGPQGNLILVFWLAAAIAQIYRYRHVSTPIEREQTKWIVFGLVVAFVIVAIPSLIQFLLPDVANSVSSSGSIVAGLIISNTWIVATLLIPTTLAVAVLRTHLWDIDLIINRALVYGTLTALLAAVYFAVVVGLEALTGAVTGKASQQPVVIVVATLLIAALFTPLRRRIQATIDHRFYRRKYDAAKTLQAFSATLRTETDLDRLSEHVVSVVEQTMQPARVSLWLRPRGEQGGRSSRKGASS